MTLIYVPAPRRSLARRLLDRLPGLSGLCRTRAPIGGRFAPRIVIECDRRPRDGSATDILIDPLIG